MSPRYKVKPNEGSLVSIHAISMFQAIEIAVGHGSLHMCKATIWLRDAECPLLTIVRGVKLEHDPLAIEDCIIRREEELRGTIREVNEWDGLLDRHPALEKAEMDLALIRVTIEHEARSIALKARAFLKERFK